MGVDLRSLYDNWGKEKQPEGEAEQSGENGTESVVARSKSAVVPQECTNREKPQVGEGTTLRNNTREAGSNSVASSWWGSDMGVDLRSLYDNWGKEKQPEGEAEQSGENGTESVVARSKSAVVPQECTNRKKPQVGEGTTLRNNTRKAGSNSAASSCWGGNVGVDLHSLYYNWGQEKQPEGKLEQAGENGTASFVVDYNIAEEEEVNDMSSVMEEGLSFDQDSLGSYDTAAGPFDVYGPEENR